MSDASRGNSVSKNSDRIATRALYQSAFPIIADWAGMSPSEIVSNEPLSNLGRSTTALEKDLIDGMPESVVGANGVNYDSDADDFDATWTAAANAGHLSTVSDVMDVVCDTYCQVQP